MIFFSFLWTVDVYFLSRARANIFFSFNFSSQYQILHITLCVIRSGGYRYDRKSAKKKSSKCSPIGPIVNNFTDYIKSVNNSRNISQRSDSDRDKKPKSDFTQVFLSH